MAKLEASIKKVEDVLKNLSIPFFQRKYCWKESNVHLLLQDVNDSLNNGKQLYRIGSVILYKEEGKNELQIVDGQQRITTILLILNALNPDFIDKDLYNSIIIHNPREDINKNEDFCQNRKFIKEWIKEKIVDRNKFYKYLTEHCEFVKIVVGDLSEAFQMFDSQNGRGKELEAYNLLKAYHIRAMETETQETKIECDKRWESSTKYRDDKNQTQDILKQVLNEQLYRIRKWSRKDITDDSYDFNKYHIAEFKGMTIDKSVDFPFQNLYLLQYVTKKYLESFNLCISGIKSRFLNGDSENINPFVLINQKIINGKHFFDYIESYVEIYKQLFIVFKIHWLKETIQKYCPSPSDGTGNYAMFELFKSLLLILFDRYGENEMRKYWQDLYVIVYSSRLKNKRNVLRQQIIEHPKELFTLIECANNNYELSCISDRAKKEIENLSSNFKYEHWQDKKIKDFYKEYKEEDPIAKGIIEKFKEKYGGDY